MNRIYKVIVTIIIRFYEEIINSETIAHVHVKRQQIFERMRRHIKKPLTEILPEQPNCC